MSVVGFVLIFGFVLVGHFRLVRFFNDFALPFSCISSCSVVVSYFMLIPMLFILLFSVTVFQLHLDEINF